MEQKKQFTIPYVKLSSERMKECLAIMEVGNHLLKKWAKHFLGNRKLRIFREKLFAGEYLPGVDIPQDDFDKIMRVRAIQEDMLRGSIAFINLKAKIWTNRAQDWRISFEDMYQEAVFAFLDALYGYLGELKKAQFQTYLGRVIDRRLQREVENQKLPLVPPRADGARELVRRYEFYRQEHGRQVTFDEFVMDQKLTDEESAILTKAIADIVPNSQFMRFGMGDCSVFDAENRTYDDFEEKVADRNLAEKIKKCAELAKLTDFQRDLVKAAQSDEYGWKARVAKKYGLTRNRAGQAFLEACNKIIKEFHKIR